MRTLSIDIGGTGLKAIVLDKGGNAVCERARVKTPRPAKPEPVIDALAELVTPLGEFARVSVGFPGVVVDGVTMTAPNLHPSWAGFPLAKEMQARTGKPVRVANDAGIQGLGVIEGRGLEMVVTLGTGMGCGIYIDGRYVPNVELGHHPFKKGASYEERVCNAVFEKLGKKKWNKRVRQVVAQLEPIFNYRKLYLGGGNAKHVERDGLPENVVIVDNVAGLLGGIKLWE